MRTSVFKSLLVVPLLFLLTGCYKINSNLQVNSDNTVSGTYIFAVRGDFITTFGGQTALVESAKESFENLPANASANVTSYSRDNFVGYNATMKNVPMDNFSELVSSTAESDTEDPDDLKIELTGDTFVVSGKVDLATGVGDFGDLTPSSTVVDSETEALFDGAEVKVTIGFPGEIISTNGKKDGNCVSWEFKKGDVSEIEAVAKAEGGSGEQCDGDITTQSSSSRSSTTTTTKSSGGNLNDNASRSSDKSSPDKTESNDKDSNTGIFVAIGAGILGLSAVAVALIMRSSKNKPALRTNEMAQPQSFQVPQSFQQGPWNMSGNQQPNPSYQAPPVQQSSPTQQMPGFIPPPVPPAPPAPPASGNGQVPPPPPPM